MTDRIVYLNSELFYYKEGVGRKSILLFHGFGQDHRAFEDWVEALQEEYTIYTFDLFFHGKSHWSNPHAIEKEDWKKILQLFIEQEKMEHFEIGAFSIGARFAFVTLEAFPHRVKRIIAMAPDGIAANFWYRLATGSSLTRSFFRRVILKPARLQGVVRFVRFFRLESRALLRFVELQINTPDKRQRIYGSWVYFRLLRFDRRALSNLLNSNNIPVVFVLGGSDALIPARKIKR
ncbi:MAG TPA: alpha/beta fold hydrolase, partial [Cyclobacteriaceae bacterium]|nr:alpha/beta fold hydrolase [Cyclobacteriaceae bacterium]